MVVQQTTCPAFCVAAAGKYDASEQHKIHSLDAGYFVDNHLGPNLRDEQLTSSSQAAQNQLTTRWPLGASSSFCAQVRAPSSLTTSQMRRSARDLDSPGTLWRDSLRTYGFTTQFTQSITTHRNPHMLERQLLAAKHILASRTYRTTYKITSIYIRHIPTPSTS